MLTRLDVVMTFLMKLKRVNFYFTDVSATSSLISLLHDISGNRHSVEITQLTTTFLNVLCRI